MGPSIFVQDASRSDCKLCRSATFSFAMSSVRGKHLVKTLKKKREIPRKLKTGKANKFEIPGSMLSKYNRNKKAIEDAHKVEAFHRKGLGSAKQLD